MTVLGLAGAPAAAQVDEAQLFLNQRMFHRRSARSPAHHAGVAERWLATAADRPAAPAGRWTNHGRNGAPSAAIDRADRSLNDICQRNGTALIGIAGLGGAAGVTRISVDGQASTQPFMAQSGSHYTSAPIGSPLVRALMSGNGVKAASPRDRASFPPTGSRAAIAGTPAGCGIAP